MELVVLNGKESQEAHEELAQDLVAIVSSFAARIYGKRGSRSGRKRDAQAGKAEG